MGILDETQFIERMAFFDGQRLFAEDYQALHGFSREMRWLHNRSLHQAGVGSGLVVLGEKGESIITITPGYALDQGGREMILAHDFKLQVPPVAGDGKGGAAFFDLTISYPSDEDLEETETRQGLCATGGVVRLKEEPIFCWVQLTKDERGNFSVKDNQLAGDIAAGRKIVIARAEVLQCKLNRRISMLQRRSARPPMLPYIASGNATPNWKIWTTGWDFWLERQGTFTIPGEVLAFGLKTTIDTRSAGFQSAPWYTGRIDGSHVVPLIDWNVQVNPGDAPATEDFLFIEQANVGNATKDSFTLYVVLTILPLNSRNTVLNSRFGTTLTDYTDCLLLAQNEAQRELCHDQYRPILDRTVLDLMTEVKWRITWMGVEGSS